MISASCLTASTMVCHWLGQGDTVCHWIGQGSMVCHWLCQCSLSMPLLANIGPNRLWYSIPLITSVSLVYAATRHEEMGPILIHAVRFAVWIAVFMTVVVAVIQFMTWMI
jgi:hypothetical protein